MSSLNLTLDMERVQSTVQHAIRPAVEETLSECNVRKLIKDALKKPVPLKAARTRYVMPIFYDEDASVGTESLLEQMVHDGISEMAKLHVQRHLAEMKPEIEDAFARMMGGSANRLAKAFGRAIEGALKSGEWGFDLDVKVSPKSEGSDDDD